MAFNDMVLAKFCKEYGTDFISYCKDIKEAEKIEEKEETDTQNESEKFWHCTLCDFEDTG